MSFECKSLLHEYFTRRLDKTRNFKEKSIVVIGAVHNPLQIRVHCLQHVFSNSPRCVLLSVPLSHLRFLQGTVFDTRLQQSTLSLIKARALYKSCTKDSENALPGQSCLRQLGLTRELRCSRSKAKNSETTAETY